MRLLRHLIMLFVLAGAASAYLWFEVSLRMTEIVDIDERVLIDLKRGTSLRQLAAQIHDQGLIDHPDYLYFWARLFGYAPSLKAGEYSFDPGDTLDGLLQKMAEGRVEQYRLTLIEGWNFKQMMREIQAHPYIRHTLTSTDGEQVMQAIGHPDEHPEGRFYPDTYFISKGMTDIEVLTRAYDVMSDVLAEAWPKRAGGLPLETPYEALILASIVEKETAIDEERALIAGVFTNRLRKRMRLQTDPTVIYGLGDSYDGDIRFRDLRTDTPYNTYTRRGLTPTPIAMPGIEAIEAVLNPEETEALYFVAYGDGSGRHHFSTTLAEHEAAVDRYQRRR